MQKSKVCLQYRVNTPFCVAVLQPRQDSVKTQLIRNMKNQETLTSMDAFGIVFCCLQQWYHQRACGMVICHPVAKTTVFQVSFLLWADVHSSEVLDSEQRRSERMGVIWCHGPRTFLTIHSGTLGMSELNVCETVEIWTVFIWQFITYCRLSLFYQSWYNVEVMFAKGFCGFLWFHMLKRCNEKDLVRHRHVHALGIWHAAFGRSQSRIDDAVEASFDSRIAGIGDLKVQSSDVLAKSPINDHVDASWIQYLQRTCWGFCKRWTRTACHPMYTSYTFMQIYIYI